MGWFRNDKDPDNILADATSLLDKFTEVMTRAEAEIAEWNSRLDTAKTVRDNAMKQAQKVYAEKADEVSEAQAKLEKAKVMSGKVLQLFED